jgi:hypothetical protein
MASAEDSSFSAAFRSLAWLSLKLDRPGDPPDNAFPRSRGMFKIRLSFALAATVAAALTTFVTVAPQAATAGTFACVETLHEPVRA